MFNQNQCYDRRPNHQNYPNQPSIEEFNGSNHQISNNPENRSIRNDFPDIFVKEFICDQIIQSIGVKNDDIIFYCFFCDEYINDMNKVRQHVYTTNHQTKKAIKRYNKGLNKKILIKSINSKDLEYLSENEKQELIRRELDRIPNDLKHFYCRRGIRLMNCIGEYAYYCKTCETQISSFDLIQNHLDLESHRKLEDRPNLFRIITDTKTVVPVIGLQFITEYRSSCLKELIYKCNVCNVVENANQMFLHLNKFRHRLNILNRLQNTRLEFISEEELNHKFNEWHKKSGFGFMIKSNEIPDTYWENRDNYMKQIRDIFGTITYKHLSLEEQFAVRITNESEAEKVTQIIESLKDSSVKYYSNKKDQIYNNY